MGTETEPVPHWFKRFSNLYHTRVAILLATIAAVLSIVTGIVNIGTPVPSGPLEPIIPRGAAQLTGYTGTMTGFLMLLSAYGLKRGFRIAWYSTLTLLPMTAVQGLAQSTVLSYPLVVISFVAIPVVYRNCHVFDRPISLTATQSASLAAIIAVQIYGTVGTYTLRNDFSEVSTLLDAFYFTIVTSSTVGYGDITATTQFARLFSISVLFAGVASFGVALGTLLGPLIEARLATVLGNMTEKQLDVLDDHYIIAGCGDLTEPILEYLGKSNVVIIVQESDRATYLRENGYQVVVGNPSDEEPLRRVHIQRARGLLVATNEDTEDAMTILTARELQPDLRIVATATERENINKLKRAGADVVFSPAVLGGRLLVESVQGSDDPERILDEFLEPPS